MSKRIIDFQLNNPVSLIPISGETHVQVVTNGRVAIRENDEYRKRKPYHKIAETDYARLSLSPHGNSMTVKIILPFEQACEEEFYHQLRLLFKAYERECEM